MKLKVIGWTYPNDSLIEGNNDWAARNAIIDDIRKNGYIFSGWAHQECDGCTPVLNDGKMYSFSQRGWGGIMAEAYEHNGRMDYAGFAFANDKDNEIRPKEGYDEKDFELEKDLFETFDIKVSQEVFSNAKETNEITLDDLLELRFLGSGDTVNLICGTQKEQYFVFSVDRKKDLTDKRMRELHLAMCDYKNETRRKEAEKEFNNTKIVMIIRFKSK